VTILCTTSIFSATLPDGYTIVPNPYGRRLSEAEVADLVREHQPVGLIAGVEPLTRRVLMAATGLRVISRCGVGVDSIDLEAARELGIAVCTTPEAPVQSVAELTVGLMLAAIRRIPQTDAAVRSGGWPDPAGNLLGGRTVGVVGCGRIGSAVASLVSGFGCNVLGCDPVVTKHDVCTMVSLDELLEASDIVTLHAPSVESTRRMINASTLSQMRQEAILVNTARGALVDEEALVVALHEGRIAIAALDVFDDEPYAGPLREMADRTILTSHIASGAREARARMEAESVANLVAALRGNKQRRER
jgi:D-3-phosphoglycerate dehydrogenase / 2-oxoglutarate reductase